MMYTKGKWIPVELTSDLREKETAIKSNKGLWIASVHQDRDVNGAFISEVEMRANARLIAAAPDLLTAIFDLLPYVESCVKWEQSDCPAKADMLRIKSVIARATGERKVNND